MKTVRAVPGRYCTFFLDDECFGIDILTVREINRQVAITRAPGAPPSVRGFLNLRGQIVTVIDPAVRMGYEPRQLTRSTRVVILKTNAEITEVAGHRPETSDELAGLWVDRISDVISIKREQIDAPPPARIGKTQNLIAGVVQQDQGVIRLVNPAALLRLNEAS